MIHAMIFLLVVSLGLGLGSIATSAQLYGRYRRDFIKYLMVFLIAVNTAAILGIFSNYVGENLRGSVSPDVIRGVDIGYRLLANIVLVVIAGSLILMVRSLVNLRPSRKYLGALALVWTVLMGVFLIKIDAAIEGVRLPIPTLVNVIIDQLVQYIVLFECIHAFYHTASMKNRVIRLQTRRLLAVFGAVWLFLILMSALLLMGKLANDVFNLISGVLYILLNALPLVFLRPYLRACYGAIPDTNTVRTFESVDDLCDRHGISPRERDIIRLVCKGYPNKKIADELCISLSTVKDHNYRIFRKLDVTSRTQVMGMFTAAPCD